MNNPTVAERPTRTPAPGWADVLLVVLAAGLRRTVDDYRSALAALGTS